jgi:hypothetical protein
VTDGANGADGEAPAPAPSTEETASAETADEPHSRHDALAWRARGRRILVDWRRPVLLAVTATVGFRLVVTWIALVSADGVDFPHVVARHPGVLTQVLAQWDAGYYLGLAAHGYPAHAASAAVQHAHLAFYAFGPLYPALVALVHGITGAGGATSGELVSTLGLAVALAALSRLLHLEVGRRAADAACVLLLAWPAAFFLVATYPESVTLAAATLSFLCARRGRYVAAGVFAAAAAMGKFYMVVLVVPLLMEVWSAPRERWRAGQHYEWLSPWRVTVARALAVAGPTVLAFAAWIAYEKARFGEWLAFVHAQGEWFHRHLSWPWTAIGHAVSDLVHWRLLDTSTASVTELFDLVTMVVLAVAAVVAFIRIRPSYGVLLGVAWCVFAFQTILLSETREVLVLFPLFAALGVWVARHQWRERALLFVFLPCGYFLLERFVTGRFAG